MDVADPRAELGRAPGDPGREVPVVADPDGSRDPGEQVARVRPPLLGSGEQHRERGEQLATARGHVLVDGLHDAQRRSRRRRCQRVGPGDLRGEPDQPAPGDDVHPVDPVPHQPTDGERQRLGRAAGRTIETSLEEALAPGAASVRRGPGSRPRVAATRPATRSAGSGSASVTVERSTNHTPSGKRSRAGRVQRPQPALPERLAVRVLDEQRDQVGDGPVRLAGGEQGVGGIGGGPGSPPTRRRQPRPRPDRPGVGPLYRQPDHSPPGDDPARAVRAIRRRRARLPCSA